MEGTVKQIFPSYYKDFRCIAGDCRHSCCIGWEIDIDAGTMEVYRNFPDIVRRIDTSAEPAHFRLTDDERCPFLDKCGLCEIILTHGEDHLCQICNDHPRFRNFFTNRTETGLGLCCEAAAALILGYPDKVTFGADSTGGGGDSGNEREFFSLRGQLFAIAQNRDIPIAERMREILAFADAVLPERRLTEWADYYMVLECLDPARDEVLSRVTDAELPFDDHAVPAEQLLVYFLYRHLAPAAEDGMFAARTAFAVLSTQMVFAMASAAEENGGIRFGDLAEAARLYSSEVEYSEENMDDILWELDDIQEFR